ncbi:MAG TPA: EutN/CcmL family microcompartment protein [Bryobacteraceae bacterium]|nr:EutN/CcmL family microcompartment protein [Bryobacteraceae bacterium]
MLIGRVIGEAVATRKHPAHEGLKLLLVQPLELDGSDRGAAILAVDSVQAGVGDRVLVATDGFSAMTAVDRPKSPTEMVVLGIVDEVSLIEG